MSLQQEIAHQLKSLHLHEQYHTEFFDENGNVIVDNTTAFKLHNALLLSQTIKRIDDKYRKCLPKPTSVEVTKGKMDSFVEQCRVLDRTIKETDTYFHYLLPKPSTAYNEPKFQSALAFVYNMTAKKNHPDVRGRFPVNQVDPYFNNSRHYSNITLNDDDEYKRLNGKFEGFVENLRLEGELLKFRIESFLFPDSYFEVQIPLSDIEQVKTGSLTGTKRARSSWK